MYIHFLIINCFLLNISKISAQLSSVHTCLKESKEIPNNRLNGRTLAGIIGFGWDDLQSVRTKPVFFEEFKLCKAEPTGHYLIPDSVVAVPVLKLKIDQMANYYENFKNFKEEISNTFVASASGGFSWFSASAAFSKVNEKTKENFVKYKSSLLYTKLQYEAFYLYQDSVGLLAPGFIDRIEQIAYSISQNLKYQAKYLAEMVVKDYGTHYISSANIGAMIEQKIFVKSDYAFSGNSTLEGVRIAAAAKFATFFNVSFSIDQSVSAINEKTLTNISKASFLETKGGPDIDKILSGNSAFNVDNIVPYNFNGDWLYQIVSKRNFPNISIDLLLNIQNLLKNATEMYYEKNTIYGCMDMNSPNFDFKANYDDGTCLANNDSYSFGGFYQTCKPIDDAPQSRCDNLKQINTIIGAPKCDETIFESVKIFETIYEFEKRQEIHERIECKRKLFNHCIKFNVIVDFIDKVKIKAFWCRKKENVELPAEKGAMFGGVFENSEPNSVTGEMGCPGTFKSYRIGRNTTICLSYQYEQDRKYSIPFAGFFSCQSTANFFPNFSATRLRSHEYFRNGKNADFKNDNKRGYFINGFPLNSTSEVKNSKNDRPILLSMSQCPEGFTQKMLPIEMDCDVFYCVKKHTIEKYCHPKIIRPPYSLPQIAANKYSETNIRAIYDGTEIFSTPMSSFSDSIKISGKSRKSKKRCINFFIHQIEEEIKRASNNFTATSNETLTNIKNFKTALYFIKL